MSGKRAFLGLIAGVFGGISGPVWAGTCALCREALQSGGSASLVKGFYWSILLILFVPLVVLALGVRYAWKRYL